MSGPGPGGGMRMQTTAKPKNFKQTLFRLLGYMKPRSVAIIVVFIFAILSTIFNIFSPKELGKATTEIFKGVMSPAGIDNDKIFNILMIVLVLYLGSSLFSFIQQYVMSSVAQRTVYDMRKDLKAKMARLPLKYYDTRSNGDILSRSVNDMDNIANTLQQSLTQAITAIVQMIGVLIMMLTISWQMTLIVLVTVPISIILVAIIAGRSQRYFGAQQRNLGILNDTVSVSVWPVVFLLLMERFKWGIFNHLRNMFNYLRNQFQVWQILLTSFNPLLLRRNVYLK